MTIPAAKVKALCTESEAALVRASRKAELAALKPAEVKRLTARARKLVDKWQSLDRDQARTRSQKVGSGDLDTNTQIKEQIFREALTSFEGRLAKLEAVGAAGKKKSATSAKPTKKARNVEHRATRAAVRKGMATVEKLVRVEKRAAKSAAGAKSKAKK